MRRIGFYLFLYYLFASLTSTEFAFFTVAAYFIIKYGRKIHHRVRRYKLVRNQEAMTLADFYQSRDLLQKQYSKRAANDFEGVYVFQNKRNRRHYVGQSVNVLHRVHTHIQGRGNGDLHTDLTQGDPFTVKIFPLNQSGYATLNDFERELIGVHHAYSHGYNRTRGNR